MPPEADPPDAASGRTPTTDALAECAATVRRHDRDRYFAALLAPPEGRAALFALYAFNLEIARVREAVSEPMLGQIRLQWWRDSLDGVFGAAPPRRHAVVLALADAARRHDLPRAAFERMIDAREFDLDDRQPGTFEELASYAEGTSGTLAILAVRALGISADDVVAAAGAAGTAWALAGLIRAIPFHAAQRRCYLPRDLLADDDSVAALFRGKADAAAKEAIAAVARAARDRQAKARATDLPRRAMPALAAAALLDADLARLERLGFDVFRFRRPSLARRQLRLLMAAARGRI